MGAAETATIPLDARKGGRIEHMNPWRRGSDGLTWFERRRYAKAFARGAGAMPSAESFDAARRAPANFKSP